MGLFERERKLHFVNRGDPSMGIFVVMALLLGMQILNGHQLPEPRYIVTVLGSFIVAVTIHEFMHAWTANRLGDDTAAQMGRLTLNPIAHFEPFGFFGMVMISLGFGFIGWGKPVPVNPYRLHGSSIDQRKHRMGLVALAGPLSNVAMAALAAGGLRLIEPGGGDAGTVGYVLGIFFYVNVLLASFNCIPIPPLDGYKILVSILPNFWYPKLAPLERYGFMILFLVIFVGGRFGGSITDAMISPVQDLLFRALL